MDAPCVHEQRVRRISYVAQYVRVEVVEKAGGGVADLAIGTFTFEFLEAVGFGVAIEAEGEGWGIGFGDEEAGGSADGADAEGEGEKGDEVGVCCGR